MDSFNRIEANVAATIVYINPRKRNRVIQAQYVQNTSRPHKYQHYLISVKAECRPRHCRRFSIKRHCPYDSLTFRCCLRIRFMVPLRSIWSTHNSFSHTRLDTFLRLLLRDISIIKHYVCVCVCVCVLPQIQVSHYIYNYV